MRWGEIVSKIAIALGLCLLLSAPSFSQQWPYNQRVPQSANPYGYGNPNGFSSRIIQQPIVQYADPNSAILQWRTDGDFNTFVRIGTDPGNLNGLVPSSGKGNPKYARLSNQLQPGQTYFFQIFDPSNNPLTPVLAFQTPVRGRVQGVPAQLATNMAYNGYGRRDQGRDWDRDRDRDQYQNNQHGYGNNRLPQGDYGYGYGPNGNGAGVRIMNRPEIRFGGPGSAVVTWTTNVPASAVIHYGTDPNHLNQVADAPWGGTTHTVAVNNLQRGVDYYFQVESNQAQGTGSGITCPVVHFRPR